MCSISNLQLLKVIHSGRSPDDISNSIWRQHKLVTLAVVNDAVEQIIELHNSFDHIPFENQSTFRLCCTQSNQSNLQIYNK